jgi:hypothetical protein
MKNHSQVTRLWRLGSLCPSLGALLRLGMTVKRTLPEGLMLHRRLVVKTTRIQSNRRKTGHQTPQTKQHKVVCLVNFGLRCRLLWSWEDAKLTLLGSLMLHS